MTKFKLDQRVKPASLALFPSIPGLFNVAISVDDIGTVVNVIKMRNAIRYEVQWDRDRSLRFADEDRLQAADVCVVCKRSFVREDAGQTACSVRCTRAYVIANS
jgi:hypothetical protein